MPCLPLDPFFLAGPALRSLLLLATLLLSACAADVVVRQEPLSDNGRAAAQRYIDQNRGQPATGMPGDPRLVPAKFNPLPYIHATNQLTQPSGIGVCFSGGGNRAALFSLGALWALHDMDLLGSVAHVGAVSGGSVTAAYAAAHWSEATGTDAEFRSAIADPILRFSHQTIDIPSVLLGLFTPRYSIHSAVARSMRSNLFGDLTVRDLNGPGKPKTRIMASQIPAGAVADLALVRHTSYFADTDAWDVSGVSVGNVVAASAAFPPFLAPARWRYRVDDPTSRNAAGGLRSFDVIYLDGGVLDNLGTQACASASVRIIVDAHIESHARTPRTTNWLSTTMQALSGIYESRESLLVSAAATGQSMRVVPDGDVLRIVENIHPQSIAQIKQLARSNEATYIYIPLQLYRANEYYGDIAVPLSWLLLELGVKHPQTQLTELKNKDGAVSKCLWQSTRFAKVDRQAQVGIIQWAYMVTWASTLSAGQLPTFGDTVWSRFSVPMSDEQSCLWQRERKQIPEETIRSAIELEKSGTGGRAKRKDGRNSAN